jgi:hypothetical protein
MAISNSTGYKNAVAVTGSIRSIRNGGLLKIYAGTPPATADDALDPSNTLLVTISDNGTGGGLQFDPTPVSGVLQKQSTQTWSGTAVASGTATFFRWEMPGDTGNASTTAVRVQGAVGLIGADLNLASTNITTGSVIVIASYNIGLI